MAQRFQNSAGDVRAAGILHRVVIGEGNGFENRPALGFVECGPAAVAVLEGEQPIDAAVDRLGRLFPPRRLSDMATMAVSSTSG